MHLHGAEFAPRLQWSKEQTIMAMMRVIGSLVNYHDALRAYTERSVPGGRRDTA